MYIDTLCLCMQNELNDLRKYISISESKLSKAEYDQVVVEAFGLYTTNRDAAYINKSFIEESPKTNFVIHPLCENIVCEYDTLNIIVMNNTSHVSLHINIAFFRETLKGC